MKLRITVHGVAYEVDVEVLDPGEGFAPPALPLRRREAPDKEPGHQNGGTLPSRRLPAAGQATPGSASQVTSPIGGTVIEVKCSVGQSVSEGQVLLVVEAMKMNTSIAAPAPGRVKQVRVAAGDAVREGQVLVEFD